MGSSNNRSLLSSLWVVFLVLRPFLYIRCGKCKMSQFLTLLFLGLLCLVSGQRIAGEMTQDQVVPAPVFNQFVSGFAHGRLNFLEDGTPNTLLITVEFEQLSGPPTAINLNGPAIPGAVGPVVFNLGATGGIASPVTVDVPLTQVIASNAMQGLLYVEILTAANPAGEIRAQLTAPSDYFD